MSESSVKIDLSKLRTFVKGLDDKHVVKVGIFGSKNSRNSSGNKTSGKTNAEIGAIHEFGSFHPYRPIRSFLRMPLSVKSKEIIQIASIGILPLLAQGKMVQVLKNLGIACEKIIDQAFASRGFSTWDENKPSTIRRKKGSEAVLIDTSQLRRSIASKVEKI